MNMASMEEVEAAVSKNNNLTLGFRFGNDCLELVNALELA
jgi:hypothetical protein